MAVENTRKLAVLLHADIVGSTRLVRLNETIAHERFRSAFKNLSEVIQQHGGITHEIRGDALVAEFSKASDAVAAALETSWTRPVYDTTLPKAIVSIINA